MKNNAYALITGTTLGFLSLFGCGSTNSNTPLTDNQQNRLENSNQLIYGEVLEEKYYGKGLKPVGKKKIEGIVSQAYSNPTVTVGDSTYLLKVNLDDGNTIILNVIDGKNPKESVDFQINPGDRIGFRKGNLLSQTTTFPLGDSETNLMSFSQETGLYTVDSEYVTRRAEGVKLIDN